MLFEKYGADKEGPMVWFKKVSEGLYNRVTSRYTDRSLFEKRRIFYNIIVIIVCLMLCFILLANMAVFSEQNVDDPLFFVFLIFLLLLNLKAIDAGITGQIIPSYAIVVFVSIFYHFNQLGIGEDIVVIGMFSFITMIWLLISYKWWHLLIHFFNTLLVTAVRLRDLSGWKQEQLISVNSYLTAVNAYIFLNMMVVLSFMIFLIMQRELEMSNREVEEQKKNAHMFERIITAVNTDSSELENIRNNLDAYFDPMTGCLNRLAYENLFKKNADRRYACSSFLLTYMDLNGLKYVNDNFGHEQGDIYLKTYVKGLNFVLPNHEGVYRIGGDEFVMITVEFNENELMDYLDEANNYLFKNFTGKRLDGRNFAGRFSYGTVHSLQVEDCDIKELEKQADQKMYEMKIKSKMIRIAKEA